MIHLLKKQKNKKRKKIMLNPEHIDRVATLESKITTRAESFRIFQNWDITSKKGTDIGYLKIACSVISSIQN